jgi:uncharacterized protein (TIRG00374 family)
LALSGSASSPSEAADVAEAAKEADQASSIGRRLRSPSTWLSFAIPVALLALVLKTFAGINFGDLARGLAAASPLPLVLAALVFYAVFAVRGWRWQQLLGGVGIRLSWRDATEILSLSWFVNCVVPARIGDVYRAYLLRRTRIGSASAGIGTVIIERGLDLVATAGIAVAAGLWITGSGVATGGSVSLVGPIRISAIVLVVSVLALVAVIGTHERILAVLPLPVRFSSVVARFAEGLKCLNRRNFVPVSAATVLSWLQETVRLSLVLAALHLEGVNLSYPEIAFLAMVASLLSAIPFTPAGLGLVEAGMIGVLTGVFGLPATDAAMISLLDRAISTYSIIVLGGLLYLVSAKTRPAKALAT